MKPIRPSGPQAAPTTFRLLLRTMGHLRRSIGPFFANYGISQSQWNILWSLYLAEEKGRPPMRMNDLVERLFVRAPTITSSVDRLVRAGHVRRVDGSKDQREKHVQLSPAGRKLVRTLHDLHAKKVTSLLKVLTAAEQRQLNEILVKFTTMNQCAPAGITPPAGTGRNGKSR